MSKIVNVCVKNIRPNYNNLKEWCDDSSNIYIGRKGIVFITNENGSKERYPKIDSIWANPYKNKNYETREDCLLQYKKYIEENIKNNPELYNIKSLLNKNLGCWCNPLPVMEIY